MVKNERGFTLIEMLIVLLVISILLIITIPNMSKNSDSVKSKGCEALQKTVEAQVQAYFIEHETFPASIQTLVDEEYISQGTCPDGTELVISSEGNVSEKTSPTGT
ncbi:prepilin-type N-terminal cleavage/methylation domain-containing protein [Halobacillus litoralis]|uniref:ComG operon protein 3 n=1 Tax=Halobacillus litoralis TaxID=45668 RepID=A0A845FED4_9BACI|nr:MULTISPECIES: competence type IV pilus major pilin ComGC [Halobacillus]MBN9653667.1 prepilin-type N-terminal cleavage/methylation domain-containing protein [Halobacillus sp. GSS1]MYL71905.1 prepilin-type N-terminal cleavage/methylation domain-containing protein [Halobacillus litoralis]